jgi:hypothetical protein
MSAGGHGKTGLCRSVPLNKYHSVGMPPGPFELRRSRKWSLWIVSHLPRSASPFIGAFRAPLRAHACGHGSTLDSLKRLAVRITAVGLLPLLGLVGLELILGGGAVSSHGGMP